MENASLVAVIGVPIFRPDKNGELVCLRWMLLCCLIFLTFEDGKISCIYYPIGKA